MTAMPNMHSEDTLKMGMFQCELMEEFQNDQVWGQLCEYATTMDNAHQISSSFAEKYNGFVQAQDHNGLMGALRADMLDNYIVGAFAAKKIMGALQKAVMAYRKQGLDYLGNHTDVYDRMRSEFESRNKAKVLEGGGSR